MLRTPNQGAPIAVVQVATAQEVIDTITDARAHLLGDLKEAWETRVITVHPHHRGEADHHPDIVCHRLQGIAGHHQAIEALDETMV